jgi:hypothetical protein
VTFHWLMGIGIHYEFGWISARNCRSLYGRWEPLNSKRGIVDYPSTTRTPHYTHTHSLSLWQSKTPSRWCGVCSMFVGLLVGLNVV